MSKGYITSDDIIIVSGRGAVDYAVTLNQKFPTDRADMDAVAQRVNALGAQAFEQGVAVGTTCSFIYSDNKCLWETGKKELPEVQIALDELAYTLTATKTASYKGKIENKNFQPPVQNSSSSSASSVKKSSTPKAGGTPGGNRNNLSSTYVPLLTQQKKPAAATPNNNMVEIQSNLDESDGEESESVVSNNLVRNQLSHSSFEEVDECKNNQISQFIRPTVAMSKQKPRLITANPNFLNSGSNVDEESFENVSISDDSEQEQISRETESNVVDERGNNRINSIFQPNGSVAMGKSNAQQINGNSDLFNVNDQNLFNSPINIKVTMKRVPREVQSESKVDNDD